MASLHKNDVTDVLAAMASGMAPPLPEDKHNRIDPALGVEVQTDKDMVKLVGCRECARPLVVTTFFAPAKGICRSCKGEAPDGGIATVGQPIPGQTDPAKAVNLTDTLVHKTFAMALCPVHPDDEAHVMKLINVVNNDNYGPGEWVVTSKGRAWRQTETGQSVRHQCQKCLATVDYSTVHIVKFKPVNEPKQAPNLGAPHRNTTLGVDGDDPSKGDMESLSGQAA